jgi:hypothetical protein
MTDEKVPDRAAGVGRLGTAAAWISAVCCLPYLVLRVLFQFVADTRDVRCLTGPVRGNKGNVDVVTDADAKADANRQRLLLLRGDVLTRS